MKRSLNTKLADLSHAIWSSWMIWMFDQGTLNDDGTWTMPAEKVTRWQRQMDSGFNDLTEKEQKSDYAQAEKIFAVLEESGEQMGFAFKRYWLKVFAATEDVMETLTTLGRSTVLHRFDTFIKESYISGLHPRRTASEVWEQFQNEKVS